MKEPDQEKSPESIMLAIRVRGFRDSKYLSQVEFAQRCGLTQKTVSNMETAHGSPLVGNVMKICAAFPELNADWLLRGRGEPNKPPPIDDKSTFSAQYVQRLERKIEELEITLANLMRMFGTLGKPSQHPRSAPASEAHIDNVKWKHSGSGSGAVSFELMEAS
jgi:transcriptional regulator with XRE-family HTH domain